MGASGEVSPPNYFSNKVDSSKFNLLTFFPKIFYAQFRHFMNMYFLVLALVQLIPVFRIGFLTPHLMPLAIIMFVSCIRELIDEYQRRQKDSAINNEVFT